MQNRSKPEKFQNTQVFHKGFLQTVLGTLVTPFHMFLAYHTGPPVSKIGQNKKISTLKKFQTVPSSFHIFMDHSGLF